jgi:hypothetical protein
MGRYTYLFPRAAPWAFIARPFRPEAVLSDVYFGNEIGRSNPELPQDDVGDVGVSGWAFDEDAAL